jgi:hypothetical protein
MNLIDKIIAYESGDMGDAQKVYFFSELIRNGMAWTLQGHYGRTANMLIQSGIIMRDGDIDEMRAIEYGIEM